jgi:hypothetical protein
MRRYFLSKRTFCLALVAIAAVLVIGGCGNDDRADVTVETGSLSKAQFIKRADKICRESIYKMQLAGGAFLRTVEGSKTPFEKEQEEAPKLIDKVVVPQFEKQIKEISSLGAPDGDEEKVVAILNAIGEGLDDAEAEPIEFVNDSNAMGKSKRLGEAYGFSECGGIF